MKNKARIGSETVVKTQPPVHGECCQREKAIKYMKFCVHSLIYLNDMKKKETKIYNISEITYA